MEDPESQDWTPEESPSSPGDSPGLSAVWRANERNWRAIAGEIDLTGEDLLPRIWADRHSLDTDQSINDFKVTMRYFREIRMAVNKAIVDGKINRYQRREKIRELMRRPIMIEVRL